MKQTWGTALLLLTVGSIGSVDADPLDQWQWRRPLPDHGYPFKSVGFGNGAYVAFGTGILLRSFSGVDWTSGEPATPYDIVSVAYGNGTFLGVGAGHASDRADSFPVVVTSSNGLAWQQRQAPQTIAYFYGICYGDSVFMAVGKGGPAFADGVVLSSTDGMNWGQPQSLVNQGALRAIAYGNHRFVAVGYHAIATGGGACISVSTNGVDWQSLDLADVADLRGVTYGDGNFVAVGNGTILTSTDGFTWTRSLSRMGLYFQSVAFGNHTFVAVGWDGVLFSSRDGLTWSQQPTQVEQPLCSVTYGSSGFVVVGWWTMLFSPDGLTWRSVVASGMPDTFLDVAYGNEQFLAVGPKGVTLGSTDGRAWNPGTAGVTNDLLGITFGNNTFVATGSQGVLLCTTNGRDWERYQSTWNDDLTCIAYGNGRFVVAGPNGLFLVSTNGRNWIPGNAGLGNFPVTSLTFGKGIFVALGRLVGAVLTSPDGVQWRLQHAGDQAGVSIAFGNDHFVIVGSQFSQVSSNGLDWSSSQAGTNRWLYPARVAFGQGTFVALGSYGMILTSTNGMDWANRNSGTANDLHALAYGKGTFVALGEWGTLLQSGPFTSPALTLDCDKRYSQGPFSLTISAPPGQNLQLQVSEDLRHWRLLNRLRSANASTPFLDFEATNFGQRYYRVLSE